MSKNMKASYPRKTDLKSTIPSQSAMIRRVSPVLRTAQIASLSSLVAGGTILSNILFGITLPYPLFEFGVAPAFYLALGVVFPRKISFLATAIGSAIGEFVNLVVLPAGALFGGAAFAPVFVPGIVWARAPETLIVYRFRNAPKRKLALGMAIATVYETLAYFLPDWLLYSFTFVYQSPAGLWGGFALAAGDIGTMADLVWIPVAFGLIRAVRRAFNTQYFD